jgi:protein-S-isoprenylcysteine O-methyltransferase Ste14
MADRDLPRLRLHAALATLLFLAVAPGIVAGLAPWLITWWQVAPYPGAEWLRPLGLLVIAAGVAVLLSAFARFALQGLGTPAPIYPTDRLIVGGAYRHVRNPMYLAVLAIVAGQVILFGSAALAAYAVLVATAFHLFVVLYEEPTLARRFPADYRRYRTHVRRWLPQLHAWTGGERAQ